MDETKPSWIFDNLGGGMDSGPNAGPTVEFRGNPSYYIAREALQNILDAHDVSLNAPAEAEFSVVSIPAQDLPDANNMQAVLSACAAYLKEKGLTDNALEFENSAKKIIRNDTIKVLRISDSNTVGMTEGNWFRFAEAVGFSNKNSGSGGSFGLGKGAYYVSSGFLSLFISSVYEGDSYIFAGKSIVTTFRLDGTKKQNNGTYGINGQKPIRDKNLIPSEFVNHFPNVFGRKRNGTDFLLPDFIGDENWETELISSILRYFWLPIITGRLTVKIQDGEVLDSSNVECLLHKYFSKIPFEWGNSEPPNPLPLYYAYRKATPVEKDLKFLGKIKWYLLPGDGYPNRIALTRKPGMVVDCLKKNSMNRYAAVFICDNPAGNSLLREMENQEHNEWKWENAKTKENREKAKMAFVEMELFFKEELQKLSFSKEERYLAIEGLDDFISMDSDEGVGTQGNEGEPIAKEYGDETTVEEAKDLGIKTKKKILSIKQRPTQSEPVIYIPPATRKGKRKKHKKNNVRQMTGISFLSFAASDSDRFPAHYIRISGDPNKKIDIIQVVAGGDDVSEKISLKEATTDKNKTKISFNDNEVHGLILDKAGVGEIKLRFSEPGKFALKINAFEISKK